MSNVVHKINLEGMKTWQPEVHDPIHESGAALGVIGVDAAYSGESSDLSEFEESLRWPANGVEVAQWASDTATLGPEKYSEQLDQYIDYVLGKPDFDVVEATQALAYRDAARRLRRSRFAGSDDPQVYADAVTLMNEAVRPGTEERERPETRMGKIEKMSDDSLRKKAGSTLKKVAKSTGPEGDVLDATTSSGIIFDTVDQHKFASWDEITSTVDFFHIYKKQAATEPLLRPEEQFLVGRSVQLGQYADRELDKGRGHNEQVLDNLHTAARLGAKAKEWLIRANTRLVIERATNYWRKAPHLDFNELVEEGNLGLIAAADKYDPERGYRFSTMATGWINMHIGRGKIGLDRTIRVPEEVVYLGSKILDYKDEFIVEHGREPTTEEIIEWGKAGEDAEKIETALSAMRSSISFQMITGEDRTEDEIIEDTGAEGDFEEVEMQADLDTLYRLSQKIEDIPEERLRIYWQVLSLKYGAFIEDLRGTTLGEDETAYEEAFTEGGIGTRKLGEKFGHSNQWVNLKQKEALKMLSGLFE